MNLCKGPLGKKLPPVFQVGAVSPIGFQIVHQYDMRRGIPMKTKGGISPELGGKGQTKSLDLVRIEHKSILIQAHTVSMLWSGL